HERCLGIDVSVLLEDPMDFGNDDMWIEDVLQHRLNPNSVEGLRFKRQFMRIAKQRRIRRGINVRTDQLNIKIAVELIGAQADPAAPATANNQDPGIFGPRLDE